MNEYLSKRMQDVRKSLTVSTTEKYATRKKSDITSISIHHSLTQSGNAESFANYHVGMNGWPGIGYTYVIKTDGTIQWCNDFETVAYHVGNSNKSSLGICYTGDFRSSSIIRIPNDKQLESGFLLLQYLGEEIPTAKSILGHCQYPGYSWKECPGFDMGWFREEYSMWKENILKQQLALLPAKTLISAEKKTLHIILFGKSFSTEVLFYGDTNYIPLEFVESLNFRVNYDLATKEISIINT